MSQVSLVKADIKKRIVDHSWDFRGSDTKCDTHGIHTYPAMMIPQVARRLIETYGQNSKNVLDPFVGSGSVLVECKINPWIKNAFGVDLNPLAILISKAKVTPIKPDILQESQNSLLSMCSADIEKKSKSKIEMLKFQNIDFWFKPQVKDHLAVIRKRIFEITDTKVRNFFLVAFSETVRKVSNTRGGEFKLYRIAEENLKKHDPNVFEVFRKKSAQNIQAMEEFYKNAKGCKVNVIGADTRQMEKKVPSGEIDLVVTSPPYGDSRTTVAYGQFSRLALQWLGFENEIVKSIDKDSLGGRPTKDLENDLGSASLAKIIKEIREKDEKRAKDVLSFYIDFNDCIKEIDRVTKKGAFLCLVVGNRTVKEIQIPTDLIIAELFQKIGYKHHQTIVRSIPSKRMPKKNSPTNEKGKLVSTMNEEYIVILEKTK